MSPERDPLVGTWRLVAVSAHDAEGKAIPEPNGPAPSGLLIYTAEGTIAVLISQGGRRRLSADRVAAPAEERAEAFQTFFAYGGRYSVDGDRVIHHVEVSSVENWVGTELIRGLKLDGQRLTLRTPRLLVGGEARVTELVWERCDQ
ncbi:MAG TPA: lipocalin-like domain-containing protein [Candidatus Dormibacteraeota bacterium]